VVDLNRILVFVILTDNVLVGVIYVLQL